MKQFMDRDFLLNTDAAKTLFHDYAEQQPIFDYHNHLSPKDIAEHRRFRNLTELWLEGDHYKWRAMRACGVDERYITGDSAPYDHWAHLELAADGQYPDDVAALGGIVSDVCYYNAERFFTPDAAEGR